MNIIIVGTAYPLRGGLAHYNALLAAAIGRRHHVETITFKRQYPRMLFPGKTQQETGVQPDTPPAPELIDSVNPFNWLAVGRMIARKKPDLMIFKYWLPFFGPCFGTIARIAKRNRHTRVLCICDNVLPHERRPFDRVFTRYAFGPVDAYIVQSAAVERDLLAVVPDARYRLVPHPLYNMFGEAVGKAEARKALGLTDDRLVLFFGYVRRYKGLHVLLEAMQRLPALFPLRLLVVGEFYDDEARYRTAVAERGLEDRVLIHAEYVPNDRVREYFSASDAVILPYIAATQSGIAQIAFNFDKPVIASDVGGLSEVVLDGVTGLIVPPDNPGALADALQRYYTEGLEDRFVPMVRQEKKKYAWENLVEAIEHLAGT